MTNLADVTPFFSQFDGGASTVELSVYVIE